MRDSDDQTNAARRKHTVDRACALRFPASRARTTRPSRQRPGRSVQRHGSGRSRAGPRRESAPSWKRHRRGARSCRIYPRVSSSDRGCGSRPTRRSHSTSARKRVILIPTSYSSVEAAPTVAHEATHAYQWSAHGEPRDLEALIERDVEARNAGLDVYEQMGRPALPYNYAREADERAKDPVAYDQSVREWLSRGVQPLSAWSACSSRLD